MPGVLLAHGGSTVGSPKEYQGLNTVCDFVRFVGKDHWVVQRNQVYGGTYGQSQTMSCSKRPPNEMRAQTKLSQLLGLDCSVKGLACD